MGKLERFAYWKSVAIDLIRPAGPLGQWGREGVAEFEKLEFKNEDELYGFFECFRPDGKGVEKVFAGIVGGNEIVQRLQKVYECTKDRSEAYFIVRRPIPATPERLVDLTTQHLVSVRRIAHAFGDNWLAGELEVLPEIKIKRQQIAQETRCSIDAPEIGIYEITGDWFIELKPVESDALLLHEAFYSIACDNMIAHYLMWPLYRDSTEIEEPFEPYFELWTHGALPFFEKPGLVNVYVADDT